jgi:hypothetical protein
LYYYLSERSYVCDGKEVLVNPLNRGFGLPMGSTVDLAPHTIAENNRSDPLLCEPRPVLFQRNPINCQRRERRERKELNPGSKYICISDL